MILLIKNPLKEMAERMDMGTTEQFPGQGDIWKIERKIWKNGWNPLTGKQSNVFDIF